MEHLFSPWRSKYIQSFKDKDVHEKECFLCNAISSSNDEENLIVQRFKHCIIILNRFPYNNGHIMIAPIEHTGDIIGIDKNTYSEINNVLRNSVSALKKVYNPHGFNIGVNLGKAGGAGLPNHLHYHIVPRWEGDTNFMTTVSDSKVISQSLEESLQLIKDALNKN